MRRALPRFSTSRVTVPGRLQLGPSPAPSTSPRSGKAHCISSSYGFRRRPTCQAQAGGVKKRNFAPVPLSLTLLPPQGPNLAPKAAPPPAPSRRHLRGNRRGSRSSAGAGEPPYLAHLRRFRLPSRPPLPRAPARPPAGSGYLRKLTRGEEAALGNRPPHPSSQPHLETSRVSLQVWDPQSVLSGRGRRRRWAGGSDACLAPAATGRPEP